MHWKKKGAEKAHLREMKITKSDCGSFGFHLFSFSLRVEEPQQTLFSPKNNQDS
jgi:hypothetical protein